MNNSSKMYTGNWDLAISATSRDELVKEETTTVRGNWTTTARIYRQITGWHVDARHCTCHALDVELDLFCPEGLTIWICSIKSISDGRLIYRESLMFDTREVAYQRVIVDEFPKYLAQRDEAWGRRIRSGMMGQFAEFLGRRSAIR